MAEKNCKSCRWWYRREFSYGAGQCQTITASGGEKPVSMPRIFPVGAGYLETPAGFSCSLYEKGQPNA